MVGLEPSCLAVFRDEMMNLLPNDWNAKRLHQQCFTLSEFLQKEGKQELYPAARRAKRSCTATVTTRPS